MSDRERKSPDGLGGNDKANRELVGGQSQIQLLTERFGAVAAQRYVQRKLAQRRAAGALPAAASQVHRAAEKGTSGGGGALPHLDAIQKSFGSHDVSHVQAHTGGAASESAAAIGAEAFASGNHVVFGGTPSLHTAAHEAAHVVQQRGGVQLKGGVGEGGDPYEQHADAVADKVVRGESAEALLTAPAAGSPASSTGSIQRKITDNANGKEITDFDLDQLSYDQARFLVEQIQELRVWNADAEDIAKIEAVLQRAPVNSASSASSPSLSAPSTKSTRKEEMKSSAALDDAATSKSSSSGDPLARIKSATLTTLKPTPIGSSRPKPVYLFDAEGKPTEKKTAARFMVDTSMTKGELANYQLLAQRGLRVPTLYGEVDGAPIVEWIQNATTVTLKQSGYGAVKSAMRLDKMNEKPFDRARWARTREDVDMLLGIGYTSRDLQFMIQPDGAICFMDLEAEGSGENNPTLKPGFRDPHLIQLSAFLDNCLKAGQMVDESTGTSSGSNSSKLAATGGKPKHF